MLWFGVWREWVANAGNRSAINQHIGGAGNDRGGREPLVIGSQITQQHDVLAHSFVPSFLEESSLNFRAPSLEPLDI